MLFDTKLVDSIPSRQKRRVYDITNVLEGIGLIEKFSKNSIRFVWSAWAVHAAALLIFHGFSGGRVVDHVQTHRKPLKNCSCSSPISTILKTKNTTWMNKSKSWTWIKKYCSKTSRIESESTRIFFSCKDFSANRVFVSSLCFLTFEDMCKTNTVNDSLLLISSHDGLSMEVPEPMYVRTKLESQAFPEIYSIWLFSKDLQQLGGQAKVPVESEIRYGKNWRLPIKHRRRSPRSIGPEQSKKYIILVLWCFVNTSQTKVNLRQHKAHNFAHPYA